MEAMPPMKMLMSTSMRTIQSVPSMEHLPLRGTIPLQLLPKSGLMDVFSNILEDLLAHSEVRDVIHVSTIMTDAITVENLAAGSGDYSITSAVTSWTNEACEFFEVFYVLCVSHMTHTINCSEF